MLTTVTTTTVTTVTTIAAMGLAAVVSIAAIVASLILFLVVKELASANGSPTSLRVAQFISVGILPLVDGIGGYYGRSRF